MTSQEREEFELVAKACGYEILPDGTKWDFSKDPAELIDWNPKTDDGDALRLATTLHINLKFDAPDSRPNWTAVAVTRNNSYASESGDNIESATRLAIWRAAVEYARSLK